MELSTFADHGTARADRPLGPAPIRPREPLTWPFFDPAAMFRSWADFLTPIRFLTHLIVPMALIALTAMMFNWYALLDHISRVFGTLGFWGSVLLGMFTANLMTKLSLGTVMGYFRADTREFGFKLKFGILPKFYVDRSPIRTLDLDDRRVCYATSLLAKLSLFAIGIFAWAMLRRTGSGLADVCLAFGITGLSSFLFVANPLLPMDGCKWISARLGRPHLREHSFKLTELVLTRRPIPAGVGGTEAAAMMLYVVLSIAFIAFFVFSIFSAMAYALERQFQGTGIVLFCIVLAMVAYFFISLRQRRQRVAVKRSQSRRTAMPQDPPRPVPPAPTAAEAVPRRWTGLALPRIGSSTDDKGRDTEGSDGMARKSNANRTARIRAEEARSAPVTRGTADPAAEADETAATLAALLAVDDEVEARSARTAAPAEADDGALAALLAEDAEAEDSVLHLDEEYAVEMAGRDYAKDLEDLLSMGDAGAADKDPAEEEAEEDADFIDALSGGKSRPADPDAPRTEGLDDVLAPLPPESDSSARVSAPGVSFNPAAAAALPPLTLSRPVAAGAPPKPSQSAPAANAVIAPAADDIFEPGQPLTPTAEGARVPARRAKGPRAVNSGGGGDDLDRVLQMGTHRPSRRGRWFRRFLWLLILVGLVWLAFRPWAFEVGGEFVIQPLDRAEVRTRTDGEITELRVSEGDWVETGAIVAVLSNWDEKRDIAVREAELARLNAQLDSLLEGPSAEQIAVAERKLATARVQAEIEATDLVQAERLFNAGTISTTALEEARSALRLAEASVNESIAELDLARAEATPSEIAAARAEIVKYEEDLRFARLKLEQTFVTATSRGQVVRPEDQPLAPIGTYLPEGGLFAELEDNRIVIAEIEVPETSIEEVGLGADVELRAWSDTGLSFFGTVQRLAPKAEEREFGRVIRVLVEVPNPDGKLSANMTGYGKIAVEERPVWEVFTRIIVRFFEVELWSWLP